MRYENNKRGFAALFAIMFVAIFASIAIALVMSSSTSYAMAKNHRHIQAAMFQAESGLECCAYWLRNADVTDEVHNQDLLDSLATTLADQLNGTANLQGQAVTYDGTRILIPQISTVGGGLFTAAITLTGDDLLQLAVTGNAQFGQGQLASSLQRAVSMDFSAAGTSPALDYGLFAKGPISIGMNLSFAGANDPTEASMYSAATGNAITVQSGQIAGDVSTAFADAVINVGATIGGEIKRGIGELEPPKVNAAIFEPFAVNLMDADDDFSGSSYTNIRIMSNTNPSFSNNVTILGVMYVEAPNYVEFKNNADITGIIVTEDPGDGASLSDHKIYFKNNLVIRSVALLPDTADFAGLRTMGGSAILAPGFEVEFKNNFQSVSGAIAAESLIVKNNLAATIYGNIIIYGNQGLEFKNNSTIVIDRSAYTALPTGFTATAMELTANPDTYAEN